ncbi:DNA polymerase III subunit epsilon [Blastochloris viridis]|uniref:DNA polymerase III subunit epsilon n=1 Tax=Blastochloris viridis TaxID=1079 RepID=A0A0H5BPA1_BLAVI|nr:DNA polymerase III subunit epsilon [Blastochloris viridis]ALK11039.1 DNA polymerase III subunit epsilon [Blastochloris viridis]BAR98973.1 DNA polymerase III epsilon subunit [Blastochloris viridis]CUU43701.1 DNA polymerase III subunit epsilon [Blastochloris viridis]
MREIVFDTETTGLDPLTGDRLVEIGCVELENRWPTGRTFHRYVNPERDVPQGAVAVHGLTADFLKDKPRFAEVADAFLEFIADSHLVAHNAAFDMGFLDAELRRLGRPLIGRERVVDTVMLARRRFPGGSNTLDALCTRFGIDNSNRVKHGALLDAELLAEVYVELVEARQAHLGLEVRSAARLRAEVRTVRTRPAPLPLRLTTAEVEAHHAFIATLGGAAVWTLYEDDLADTTMVAPGAAAPKA